MEHSHPCNMNATPKERRGRLSLPEESCERGDRIRGTSQHVRVGEHGELLPAHELVERVRRISPRSRGYPQVGAPDLLLASLRDQEVDQQLRGGGMPPGASLGD